MPAILKLVDSISTISANRDVITVKDEEILLQISLQLCQIDHSFLKNYNRLISAATKVKDQFKESFREIEDQSD